METIVHRASERGKNDLGWLKTAHSFSFANYFNPERMGFGLLRVLNDDLVAPGQGFGMHPHDNMEIVTIPLSGVLRHKDSEGNEAAIRPGEVQLMSAGTGVRHSEFNDSDAEAVSLLQIWVFPEKRNITPRYEQKEFSPEGRKNQLQEVVAPLGTDSEGVKMNQQAYFSLADLEEGKTLTYETKISGNSLYLFVIEGKLAAADEHLKKRDALGVTDTPKLQVTALGPTKLLVIEVPTKS